jgi:7-cyano-7-deazaguanine reductase
MLENSLYSYDHLGSGGSYAVYGDSFDSSLLRSILRSLARDRWDIKADSFVGWDVWHCHESTFLLDGGLPIAGTLKFNYPSSSEFMVESKSMKLYLNSFDMCKMGETVEQATRRYTEQVITDLQNLLQCEVNAHFFDSIYWDNLMSNSYFHPLENLGEKFINLMECIGEPNKLVIGDYKAEKNHIEVLQEPSSARYYTNALRSRCHQTKQKDTGTAFIYHSSAKQTIVPESFLRQVVSLREVDERSYL